MPKKKKLKLENFKVKSFITSEDAQKILGGESQETNCDEGNCDEYTLATCTCAATCDVSCAASCGGTCVTCLTCDTCGCPGGTATDAHNMCDC